MPTLTLPRCRQCGGDLIVTDVFRCGNCGMPSKDVTPESFRAAYAAANAPAPREESFMETSAAMTDEEVASVKADLGIAVQESPLVDLTPVREEPILKPKRK